MHLCDPDDLQPCNAWCQGTTHVDVAYCDPVLLDGLGTHLVASFQRWHTRRHVQEYQTPSCTIVAMKPAPEALPVQERYAVPALWNKFRAYLVTYQVHIPNQEDPSWPAGQ